MAAQDILRPYIEAEYQARDRNGVLELALMLAVDRIREHEGGEEAELLAGFIAEAERKLAAVGRLPRPFLRAGVEKRWPGEEPWPGEERLGSVRSGL